MCCCTSTRLHKLNWNISEFLIWVNNVRYTSHTSNSWWGFLCVSYIAALTRYFLGASVYYKVVFLLAVLFAFLYSWDCACTTLGVLRFERAPGCFTDGTCTEHWQNSKEEALQSKWKQYFCGKCSQQSGEGHMTLLLHWFCTLYWIEWAYVFIYLLFYRLWIIHILFPCNC